MTKLTTMATASHSISLMAMEEASRHGRRTADIDDMLVALSLDGQTAGQVLRSSGATLDAVRGAIASQHAEQLAEVGVVTGTAQPTRITFHETAASFEWNQRSLDIVARAGENGRRGDAVAVLRELLDEPSGLIAALFERLGISTVEVHARLDEAERIPSHGKAAKSEPNVRSGVSDVFIPAQPTDVWAFLTDPERVPEWDSSIGEVEPGVPKALVGATWDGRTRTERTYDDKALKIKANVRRQRLEVTALEHESTIAWRFTYPDAAHANARHVRFELAPAAGGTQLRIQLRWERDPNGRRYPLRFVLRPLHRFMIWLQLSQIGAGVSRAFR